MTESDRIRSIAAISLKLEAQSFYPDIRRAHRLLDKMDPFHHRIGGVSPDHTAGRHPIHRPIIARADHDQLRPIDEILRYAIDQTEFTNIFHGLFP